MFSTRKSRWQTAIAVGLAAMGIGASPAAAVPAQFNQTVNQMMFPVGTVSIAWGAGGPGQSRTCTNTSVGIGLPAKSAGQGSLTTVSWPMTCADGTGTVYGMNWQMSALAQRNASATVFNLASNGPLKVNDNGTPPTSRISTLPTAVPFTASWLNAGGLSWTATFTFSNTTVASVLDNVTSTITPLRITGTFRIENTGSFAMIY